MKKMIALIFGILSSLFLLLLIVAYSIFWYVTKPPPRPETPPQAVRSFEELQSRMTALAENSENMTLHVLDNLEPGPILMLSFASDAPVKHRVLLTGGVHGNEPAGTEALLQFAEALTRGDANHPNIEFDIVPVVNPWGWIHHQRRTGEQIDLNRDFASFTARESVIMRKLCDSKSYDVMVDLHEDGHVAGFYLYRLAHPDEALCRHIIEGVRNEGHPVHDGRVSKIFRARDGVISCGLWSLRLARAVQQLSLSNYFRLQGCPQAFLFESPSRLPLDARIAMHRAALNTLLGRCFDESHP